jgi:aromatic-L-amino-acid decarboxylase
MAENATQHPSKGRLWHRVPREYRYRAGMLELTAAERRIASRHLTAFFDGYEEALTSAPILPKLERSALESLAVPDEGAGVEGFFRFVTDVLLPNSTTIAHPRFLAYVLGPPTGIGPYAEAIAATINQNCNFAQLSPAASVVERTVIEFLAGLYGYPASSGGLLVGGGSMATLTALAAALHDRRPDFRDRGLQGAGKPLVLYTSEQAHRCVDKAAAMLGLGLDHVRHIPVDRAYRLRVDALEARIAEDRRQGLEPFCVVATAGTVTTGAIDPLEPIAELCRRENLWLHVDGAYGALFVLADRMRTDLSRCGLADSIALDPHKLLFAPLEAGCVLVRDRATLRNAFAYSSSYLPADADPLLTDYMDYGPQLSRDFKALKVWSALLTYGVDAFRAALGQTLELAQYLGERVAATPGLELAAPVTLTAVCFRMAGADHRAVIDALADDGTALLGPATVDGRPAIRACIANYRTTRADIDLIVQRLTAVGSSPARYSPVR